MPLCRPMVAGGLVFPTVTLTALLLYSLAVAGARVPTASDVVEIEVVGSQWSWEVRYLERNGDVAFLTVNEIRIPAAPDGGWFMYPPREAINYLVRKRDRTPERHGLTQSFTCWNQGRQERRCPADGPGACWALLMPGN